MMKRVEQCKSEMPCEDETKRLQIKLRIVEKRGGEIVEEDGDSRVASG